MKKLFLVYVICFALSAANANALNVVASNKPLHSLVAGVMKGVGEPKLLLEKEVDLHHVQLKPSQAKLLASADVVFHIHDSFEPFIKQMVGDETKRIALISSKGEVDPHIWLNPVTAIRMVMKIRDELAKRYPKNYVSYEKNTQKIIERLDLLDIKITGILHGVKTQPYIVYHDAYRQFAKRYGLNQVAVVLEDEHHELTPKRIKQVRDLIITGKAVCIFKDSETNDKVFKAITEGASIKVGELDPIGSSIEKGEAHYFKLLKKLASSMAECLSR